MQTEKELQKQCVRYMRFKYPNTVCFHPNNNVVPFGKSSKQKAYAAKKGAENRLMGVLAGIPDLIILSARFDPKRHKYYGSLNIELKTKKGKCSPEQKMISEQLDKSGQFYKVINSFVDFADVVDKYLSLPIPETLPIVIK
jgi:hypothetical protein